MTAQFESEAAQRLLDAGLINPDGTGVPTEYPKMMYKAGKISGHLLDEKPLKIGNEHDVQTTTVRSLDEETTALVDGWFFTADLTKTPAQIKAEEDAAKDAELATLRAQVADQSKDKAPKPTLSVPSGEAK